MHEMALARSIVDLVEEQAGRDAFARVCVVRLSIGALSNVDPRALDFGFDTVTRGTIAEGARLEIERPPGTGFCTDCSRHVTIAALGEPCSTCGGYRWVLVSGNEMRVVDLEVE
jgi:hydrogenase nickel incorporation protein HypA/HybF